MKTPASLPPMELYSLIRSQIEHEDNLIGQRLSWFVTSQSFFFTAYAIVVSNFKPGTAFHPQQRMLYLVIPIAALASCSLIYGTVIAGHVAITNLQKLYERESARNPTAGLPPVHGFRRTQLLGEAGPLFLPAIFLLLWIFLLARASAVPIPQIASSGSATNNGVMNVLGVSGSMRQESYGARALSVALGAAAEHGSEIRLLDLRVSELPMYRPDEMLDVPILREVTALAEWADAFLLASPDYHGSMSGALKNFLDHHWNEFAGKLFGYLCASHEKGITAMEQMRVAVRQCYGWSLPYGVAVHGDSDFGAAGELSNDKVHRRLRMLGRDLVVYGSLLREQFRRDLGRMETETFAARYR